MQVLDIEKFKSLSEKVVAYSIEKEDLSVLDETLSLLSDKDKLLFFSYVLKEIRTKKFSYVNFPIKEISRKKIKYLEKLLKEIKQRKDEEIELQKSKEELQEIMDDIIDSSVLKEVSIDSSYIEALDNYLLHLEEKRELKKILEEKINCFSKSDRKQFLKKYILLNQNKKKKLPSSNTHYQDLLYIESILFSEYFSLIEKEMYKSKKEELLFIFENILFLNFRERSYILEKYIEKKKNQKAYLEEKLSKANKTKIVHNLNKAIKDHQKNIEEFTDIKQKQQIYAKEHHPRLNLTTQEIKKLEQYFENIDILRIEMDLDYLSVETIQEIKNKCEIILETSEDEILRKFYVYISQILNIQRKRKKTTKKKKDYVEVEQLKIDHVNVDHQLLMFVKRKRPYSLNKIKEMLFLNDDDLIYKLTLLLNENLESFSLEDDQKKKVILNILNYLNYNTDKFILENREVILKQLYTIKANLSKKIENEKKRLDTPKKKENYQFLLDIHKVFEYTVLNYQYEGEIRKQKLKDYKKGDPDLYHLTSFVLFKQKDFAYVSALIKHFPSVLKLKNEKDISLFAISLDMYIDALKRKQLDEILYYEKVLETFIDSDFSDLSSYDLFEGIEKLKEMEEYFEDKDMSSYEFHIKEMIKSLKYRASKKKKTIDQLYLKYHISKDFPSYVLHESYEMNNDFSKRSDLTQKKIFTIDSNQAKNLENAVSIDYIGDKIEIGIYITDTSFYIHEFSKLEEEAKKRCFDQSNIHMFPEGMIQNYLSLKEESEKPVEAYIFTLNKNLEIVNFEVKDAVINVQKNFSFEDIKNILIKGQKDPFGEVIDELSKISYQLKRKRLNVKSLKEDEKILFQSKVGEHLISEYTIFLNHFLASYAYENNIPILYRNNKLEDIGEKIVYLKNLYQTDARFDEIISIFSQIYHPSFYSTESFGHSGLNLPHYTEVTRPNRNYASLHNQRMIKKYLKDKNTDEKEKIKDQIKNDELCNYLNRQRDWYQSFQNELTLIKKINKKYQ